MGSENGVGLEEIWIGFILEISLFVIEVCGFFEEMMIWFNLNVINFVFGGGVFGEIDVIF